MSRPGRQFRLRMDPLYDQEPPPAELLEALGRVFGPRIADPETWRRGPWPMIVELDHRHALQVVGVALDQIMHDALPPAAERDTALALAALAQGGNCGCDLARPHQVGADDRCKWWRAPSC